jgi:uncharacterized protein
MTNLQDAVEFIVKQLVKNPEEVEINSLNPEDDPTKLEINLRVNENDRGRLIGRRGRTINAIRTIIKVAAVKSQQRVNIQVID